jgi:thiamine biosynthesis protein ThiS
VKIILNGESYELPGPTSVRGLLTHLKIEPRRVAVEHNLKVLKRAAFDEVELREGDQVEVVNFVGGGATIVSGTF